MKINDVAIIIDKKIVISHYPDHCNAHFEDTDVTEHKDCGAHSSDFGTGTTEKEAIRNYCKKISGKFLMIRNKFVDEGELREKVLKSGEEFTCENILAPLFIIYPMPAKITL